MLRLGLIGLAGEKNGHPFSYTSIINGVNLDLFPRNDWKVIYDYLKTKHFSEIGIFGACVTHVWTQEKEISKSLKETCYIDNIVEEYTEMIGKVDAILLARDDHNNHLVMAKPFLESGMKVFIDKPLSMDIGDLKYFENYLLTGQLMSCSGIRYCRELDALRNDSNIGRIKLITGTVINEWEQYGIHILEGIIGTYSFKPISVLSHYNTTLTVIISTNMGYKILINTLGDSSFVFDISIYGSENNYSTSILDSFTAFKRTLNSFIKFAREDYIPYDPYQTLDLMKILIAAKISLKEGKEIYIKEIY